MKANEWIPIEKDKDGFATRENIKNMARNIPYILRDNDGSEDVCYIIDNDVNKEKFTHWKPVKNNNRLPQSNR